MNQVVESSSAEVAVAVTEKEKEKKEEKEYYYSLNATYFATQDLCSAFLPGFTTHRFSFSERDVIKPPPAKRRRKKKSKPKSDNKNNDDEKLNQPFDRVFSSQLYSRIVTELIQGREEELVDALFSGMMMMKKKERKRKRKKGEREEEEEDDEEYVEYNGGELTSALHLTLALIQLALVVREEEEEEEEEVRGEGEGQRICRKREELGRLLNFSSLGDHHNYFYDDKDEIMTTTLRPGLKRCCEMLSGKLYYHQYLREAFNADQRTSLHLPEILFLQILTLVKDHWRWPWKDLKWVLSERAVRRLKSIVDGFPPIKYLYIPYIKSHNHPRRRRWWRKKKSETKEVYGWKNLNSFFNRGSAVASCLARHTGYPPPRVCELPDNQLLIELGMNRALARDMIAAVFLSYNSLELFSRVEGLLSRLVDNYLFADLFLVRVVEEEDDDDDGGEQQQTTPGLAVWFDNPDGVMDHFTDLQNAFAMETWCESAYAFIGSTLGLFLRILARIDPKLAILPPPSKVPVFFSEVWPIGYQPKLFFTPQMMKSETAMERDDDDDKENDVTEERVVSDIANELSRYLFIKGWVDRSGLNGWTEFSGGELYHLFEYLPALLNDEAVIEVCADVIARLYGLKSPPTMGMDEEEKKKKFIRFDKDRETCERECETVVFPEVMRLEEPIRRELNEFANPRMAAMLFPEWK